MDNINLGFDTNGNYRRICLLSIFFVLIKFYNYLDKVLNEACKILRLLHLKELRDLQTQINETIVNVQQITANPKTDSSLGRVGK